MKSVEKLSRAVGVCLFVFILSGCGGGPESEPVGTVSGTLKIGQKEISEGKLHLSSMEKGASASGEITAGGAFEIEGELPVGEYKVYITKPDLGDMPPSEDGNPELNKPLKDIPKKYQSESTTDQTVEVTEGSNELTLDLPL